VCAQLRRISVARLPDRRWGQAEALARGLDRFSAVAAGKHVVVAGAVEDAAWATSKVDAIEA